MPCWKGTKTSFHKKQKSKSGYESEVTVYECEDCTGCPHKERCTRAKGNKRLYISKSFLEKRQESYLFRGKTKVKLEILLLCMGYNLNKLHAKIQNERTGSHLFPVKETA